MDIPEIISCEEQAIDTVVSIINGAKEKLGDRQTLNQLAETRDLLTAKAIVSLRRLGNPLVGTCMDLIKETIEKNWKLTDIVMYALNYVGGSQDECSQYYYFEAIFSQPTAEYPIPQATVSVFFRLEDKLLEPLKMRPAQLLTFRIEGHNTEHDVRYVKLTADWLLAVIQMKINLFKRIEEIRIF